MSDLYARNDHAYDHDANDDQMNGGNVVNVSDVLDVYLLDAYIYHKQNGSHHRNVDDIYYRMLVILLLFSVPAIIVDSNCNGMES